MIQRFRGTIQRFGEKCDSHEIEQRFRGMTHISAEPYSDLRKMRFSLKNQIPRERR